MDRRSPLRERYALGVREPLDVGAMAEAARVFVGRHDFSAFGGADRQPMRTLHRVEVTQGVRLITIEVIGDAFLRGMVRRIVAALLRVGQGRTTSGEIAVELAMGGKARPSHGEAAPPQG